MDLTLVVTAIVDYNIDTRYDYNLIYHSYNFFLQKNHSYNYAYAENYAGRAPVLLGS